MASFTVGSFATSRDIEILTALICSPLTVAQLLKWSGVFAAGGFTSQRSVLDRLQKLRLAGWVRRWPLAGIASRGGSAPDYYKLTPAGLQLLYGHAAAPPTKQFFAPIGVARHHHTNSLAKFLVHTVVAAYARGYRLCDVYPENTFVAEADGEKLVPDHRFDLVSVDGERYRYLVELDNSTETIHSHRDADNWQRKIRLHDRWQDLAGERHRVIVVTTRSRERCHNILTAAARLVRNPLRTLFYGVYLPDYLAEADATIARCFTDQRGRATSLLPLPRAANIELQSAVFATAA